MSVFLLDSTSEVPTWAHHAAGSSGALRYLSRSTSKAITRSEYDNYRAGGLHVAVVFEDGARNATGGYDQGKADAEWSLSQARVAGMPAGRPIRWAVDFDTAGTPEVTDSYADGWAAVLGRGLTGPYGGIEVVRHHANRGFGSLWQTYAWSGGQLEPRAQLYQYSNDHVIGGVGVDYDKAFGADWGQWDYQPAPVDPHGYLRFPDGPFAWDSRRDPRRRGLILHERRTVIEYDDLRRHPFIHRPALWKLRLDLWDLADRIYWLVHSDASHAALPELVGLNWGAFDRGWRYQQLIKRAQGGRLA